MTVEQDTSRPVNEKPLKEFVTLEQILQFFRNEKWHITRKKARVLSKLSLSSLWLLTTSLPVPPDRAWALANHIEEDVMDDEFRNQIAQAMRAHVEEKMQKIPQRILSLPERKETVLRNIIDTKIADLFEQSGSFKQLQENLISIDVGLVELDKLMCRTLREILFVEGHLVSGLNVYGLLYWIKEALGPQDSQVLEDEIRLIKKGLLSLRGSSQSPRE